MKPVNLIFTGSASWCLIEFMLLVEIRGALYAGDPAREFRNVLVLGWS